MFILEELDVPDPLRVELDGDDMPYAEERGSAAFESGGKLVKERIDLPGRTRPIFHVHAAPERPLTIKGAFRDWFHASGHARAQRDRLLEIWRRANLLRITWGDEERRGLLDEPKFGEESEHSITYELTFEIAETAATMGFDQAPEAVTPLESLASALRARLARRRAELAALALERNLLQTILGAVDSVVGAMADVEREVAGLDRVVGNVGARVRRVTGVLQRAQNVLLTAQRLIGKVKTETDLTTRSATDVVDAWKTRAEAGVLLLDLADTLRTLRQRAIARERQGLRLYRVKPGDTLESIAQRALGSAARSAELGLRPDELTPGRLVRLPGAT